MKSDGPVVSTGHRIAPDVAREFSEAFGKIGAEWLRQVAWGSRNGIPEALGATRRQWVRKQIGADEGWRRNLIGAERMESLVDAVLAERVIR
jgi:hypothetical protein